MDEICKNLLEVKNKMAGKISNFFIEFTLPFSIILTIVGLILFLIGVTSVMEINILNLSADVLNWNIYFLIIGFFVLIGGVYYPVSYTHLTLPTN